MNTLEELRFDNTYVTLPVTFFSEYKPQDLAEDFLIHVNSLVGELLGLHESKAERSELFFLI